MRDWNAKFLEIKSKFENGEWEKVSGAAELSRRIEIPRKTLTDAMEKHGITLRGLGAIEAGREWDWKEWEKEGLGPWWTAPSCRVGYFDIETDSFKADWGTMLTWSIKERGGPTTFSAVTKDELFESNGDPDYRLIEDLVNEIYGYDVLVTYFGTMFDVPWVRTKALHYGMGFPAYGEVLHIDLFYTVRSKLNLSRKSLDNATHWLGIDGKTPIGKQAWSLAKYGNRAGLEKVLQHNIADVEILEALHNKLAPFRKWTRSSI